MAELERSGFRTPEVFKQEARTGRALRKSDGRIADLEGQPMQGAKVLADLALTTTAQNIAHGLGRDWVGAIVCKRTSGTGLLLTTAATNNGVHIGLALTSGTATVSVLVF